MTFATLVLVTMRGADRGTSDAFERTVSDVPHVV
jgi:hypothetical protein